MESQEFFFIEDGSRQDECESWALIKRKENVLQSIEMCIGSNKNRVEKRIENELHYRDD